MDVVRCILFDALNSGLDLQDVCAASIHATKPEDFMNAISLLGIGAIDVPEDATDHNHG